MCEIKINTQILNEMLNNYKYMNSLINNNIKILTDILSGNQVIQPSLNEQYDNIFNKINTKMNILLNNFTESKLDFYNKYNNNFYNIQNKVINCDNKINELLEKLNTNINIYYTYISEKTIFISDKFDQLLCKSQETIHKTQEMVFTYNQQNIINCENIIKNHLTYSLSNYDTALKNMQPITQIINKESEIKFDDDF